MSAVPASAPALFPRRAFVTGTAVAGLMAASGLTAQLSSPKFMLQDTYLVHHVFFWLKDPDSLAERTALLDGVRGLAAIPQVKGIHVGVPADTEEREVVENSYHVSEMLLFDSLEDQAAYQEHALHHQFIADHSHRWAKVVVFDTVKA